MAVSKPGVRKGGKIETCGTAQVNTVQGCTPTPNQCDQCLEAPTGPFPKYGEARYTKNLWRHDWETIDKGKKGRKRPEDAARLMPVRIAGSTTPGRAQACFRKAHRSPGVHEWTKSRLAAG